MFNILKMRISSTRFVSPTGPSSPKKTKTSRPRGICKSWFSKYTWLYIEDGKMKCYPCIKTVQKTHLYHLDVLTVVVLHLFNRHQKTNGHTSALKLSKMSNDMSKCIQSAEKMQEQLQTSSVQS